MGSGSQGWPDAAPTRDEHGRGPVRPVGRGFLRATVPFPTTGDAVTSFVSAYLQVQLQEPRSTEGWPRVMGESTARQPDSPRPRGGRVPVAGSSVLTPPTGLPSLPQEAVPEDARAILPPVRLAPAVAEPVVAACVCSHPRSAHEHYRRGADCGVCGPSVCSVYRRRGGRMRRCLRALRLVR